MQYIIHGIANPTNQNSKELCCFLQIKKSLRIAKKAADVLTKCRQWEAQTILLLSVIIRYFRPEHSGNLTETFFKFMSIFPARTFWESNRNVLQIHEHFSLTLGTPFQQNS